MSQNNSESEWIVCSPCGHVPSTALGSLYPREMHSAVSVTNMERKTAIIMCDIRREERVLLRGRTLSSKGRDTGMTTSELGEAGRV